jgi:cytochrome c553
MKSFLRVFVLGMLTIAVAWPRAQRSVFAAENAAAETPAAAASPESIQRFDREIAPLLARRCLECHNASAKKGGLDLTSLAAARAGGESGPGLAASPATSLLWQRVAADEMPPKKPLSAAEKAMLERWLADGAPWGAEAIDRFRFSSDTRAGYDWWSLQPLTSPAVPTIDKTQWARQPLDNFVQARLAADGLAPGPEADRRALCRRLSFDLVGLPPSPEETATFVVDEAPDAYERLVDRLLASPQYGERWARHWLDVARYGESDGFEYDRLRANAWRYRDWVVDALNRDLPYDEFARLQIAGDVLLPGDMAAHTATGFLVAGAFDGLIPAGEVMKQIMRQDEMEDLVSSVGQTFLGLTVNCARCHDHKFDPIRQAEYYRLASALSGVARGNRDFPVVPDKIEELRTQLAAARAELDAIERSAREAIIANRIAALPRVPPSAIAEWDFTTSLLDRVGGMHASLFGGAKQTGEGLRLDGEKAYAQSAPLDRPLRAKTLAVWVVLDNHKQRGGAPISVQKSGGAVFDAIVFGETEPGRWIVGSDSGNRTQRVEGPEESASAETPVHLAVTYSEDGAVTVYRNGEPYGRSYQVAAPATFSAGAAELVFGLRHAPPSAGRLLAGTVRHAWLFDRALLPEEVEALAGSTTGVTLSELVAHLTPEQQSRRSELAARREDLQRRVSPPPLQVFSVTPRKATVTHRLERGNPLQPGEVVAPGGIQSLAGVSADFGLADDSDDAERRQRLAAWVTDAHNGLFARVMANRIWYYHFGAGLIETPNDFGFNGGRPSHPELLEYLAIEFQRSGFHIKTLHRAIVTSATYRQSSRPNPAAISKDAGNRLLWRYAPRRLEAEVVRDAMLQVSGDLNPRMGGPGFHDFKVINQNNSAYYEPSDPAGPEFDRRSLYRTWARGGRNPLLDTFDCPDPSATAPLRGVTTTPLQALTLLNSGFALRMSDDLAARLVREAGDDVCSQIRRAYQLAFCRDPSDEERRRVEAFVAQHGLAAFCRALFNTNEFLYVE